MSWSSSKLEWWAFGPTYVSYIYFSHLDWHLWNKSITLKRKKTGINDHKSLILHKNLDTIVLSTKSWDVIYFLFFIFFPIYLHYLDNYASYWLYSPFFWNSDSSHWAVELTPSQFRVLGCILAEEQIHILDVLLRILLIMIALMM